MTTTATITVPSTNYAPGAITRQGRTIHGCADGGAGWMPGEMSGRMHSTAKIAVEQRPHDWVWTRILEIGHLEIDVTNGETMADAVARGGKMTKEFFTEYYGEETANQEFWIWLAVKKYEKGDPNVYLENVIAKIREIGVTGIRPHAHN